MTVTLAVKLLAWEAEAYPKFITWLTGAEPGSKEHGEAMAAIFPIAYVYGTVPAILLGMTPHWGIRAAGIGSTRIGLRVLESVGTPMFLRANPTTWSLYATATRGALPEELFYGFRGKTAGTMAEIRAAEAIRTAASKPATQKGAFRHLMRLVGTRAAGRGLIWLGTRGIPVIGWGLLAVDFYYAGKWLRDRKREATLEELRSTS